MSSPQSLPTHRDVHRLAVPMILSNISIPLLGMVDTAVVGHLPEAHHLGAVAVGAMIFSFVFWGFGFLRMGTTGFVAQAHGSGVEGAVQNRFGQAAVLALALAVLVLLLHPWVRDIAFGLVDATAAVESQARRYFEIRIWASPATLMTYVLVGWFLGVQDARAPLMIMLTANLVNIILDLLFVLVFQWGVAGVALASVCGEYLAALTGLVLAFRRGGLGRHRWQWREVLHLDQLLEMVRVNTDIMLRTLCLIFAFAFFTHQGARQGDIVLAANAVLLNFQHLMAYALDGFAHAAEALVGKFVGARNARGLARAIRLTRDWSLGIALFAVLLYWVGGDWLIGLLTSIQAVRDTAGSFLPWLLISPLISVWSFWLDGIFIGATRGRDMRNTMVIALLAYLAAWWLLQSLGNHGLWAALMVFLAVRGITLGTLLPRVLRV
ncbi:MAG: MATE family efflux transporter [Xanthomonadales bacterium]|nr:MATE family efflux transporter [Xanthomonadales bacterium]